MGRMATSRFVPLVVLGLSWAVGLSAALAGPSQEREEPGQPVRLGQPAQDPPPARPRPARPRPPRPQPAEKAPAPAPIVMRTSEPVRLAFREHLGPYWTVGRVVSTVARDLREAGRSDPIVVRYMEDPARTAPDRLATRIGWFAAPREEALEGFRIEPIGEEELACVIADARSTKPLQTVTELRNWIADRGYEPAGPVYEIHHPAEPGDSGPKLETCVVARPVGSGTPAPPTPVVPEPVVEQTELTPGEPRREPERVAPRQVEVVIPIRIAQPEDAPPPAETSETDASVAAAAKAEELGQLPPPSPPEDTSPNPTEPPPAAEEPAKVPPPPAPAPRIDRGQAQAMADLLRAGSHEAVAERLMPENRAWNQADCAFAVAVVTRLEALAGRLRTTDAASGEPFVQLASACATRWQERCSSASMAARVAFRIDSKDPHAAQKRAALTAMDGVMAGVGAGVLNADQTREALGPALGLAAALWE
jgi:hypothetical protein